MENDSNLIEKNYAVIIANFLSDIHTYTLSGHIGKVVASHAEVARSSPAEVTLIYTMHLAVNGCCP